MNMNEAIDYYGNALVSAGYARPTSPDEEWGISRGYSFANAIFETNCRDGEHYMRVAVLQRREYVTFYGFKQDTAKNVIVVSEFKAYMLGALDTADESRLRDMLNDTMATCKRILHNHAEKAERELMKQIESL